MPAHEAHELVTLFNQHFKESYQTLLVRGEDEPVYLPQSEGEPYHRIVFAHGYFASALHEIAHWTVAGKRRRALTDFGYWYQPDGRSLERQRQFEQMEVKPQALEWIYSVCCGFPFRFSADNLDGETGDMAPFQQKVHGQVLTWLDQGLPNRRARMWAKALASHFGQAAPTPEMFPAP